MRRSLTPDRLVPLAVGLAFVLVVLLLVPFRFRLEFDTDEGVNAIKAMMLLRGYRLYSDLWSDQPPLFTYLLAGWFSAFGLKLTAGRLLVLLFSAGLVTLAAVYLRKTWGLLAAVLAGLTLLLLPFYVRLSVSMMIGLPAIALAFASFFSLAEWHARPTNGRLAASALLLGLSILTKGFTIVLAPLWLAGILVAAWRDDRLRARGPARWTAPLLWLAVLGGVGLLAVVFVVGPQNVGQLLDVHLEASQNPDLAILVGRRTLDSFLSESLPLFLLSSFAVWFAVRRRKWTTLYLAGWIVVGYAMLRQTSPTWYHHQLMVTIPAAVLASAAVAAAIEDLLALRATGVRLAALAVGLVCLGLYSAYLVGRGPGTVEGFATGLPNLRGPAPFDEEDERSLLAAINDHADEVTWFYTDRPIFAFLAGLPVPPNLAVMTQKRMLTGSLTEEDIAATLDAYAPEMILNARFVLPVVDEYMRTRNYGRIDETIKYRLYLRRSSP